MKDLSFPFRAGEAGVPVTSEDRVVIAGDMLKLAVRTARGEIPGFCEFGSDVDSLPFESLGPDLNSFIRSAVSDVARRWLVGVVITGVTFKEDEPTGEVQTVIEYDVGGQAGVVDVGAPFATGG